MRRYDDAIDQLHETLELDPKFGPAHEWLGYVYEKKGMKGEAIAEWVTALRSRGLNDQAATVELTFARSGFEAAAKRLAEQQLSELNASLKRGQYVAASEFVMAYTRLGKKEEAFAWLEKAVQERNRFALEFKIDPTLDSLRADPRFAKLANL